MIAPLDAMKMAEQNPNLTPKERQKVLALALMRIAGSALELPILWNFSQMMAAVSGFEVPPFDPQFVLDINRNPAAFADYR